LQYSVTVVEEPLFSFACAYLGFRVERWVISSLMVLCNANDIIEYDKEDQGFLSSAPIDVEDDNNIKEE